MHNLLRYMWVLTFREAEFDHAQAMIEVRRFVRRLRVEGVEGVYMFAPQPHPDGHGWHVNFFVAGRVPHELMERVWGRGFVWVKDWGRDRRYGPLRERVRAGAAYAAKYAGKDVGELCRYGVAIGAKEHRYEVAQGYRPRWVGFDAATETEALAAIVRDFGTPVRVIQLDEGGLWIRYRPRTGTVDPP